ncbi:hypothetical protein K491DRAFT_693739 [Lophiostoma macrostomum CBS 122681]|uniref:SMP-LTD domain-containing protein n=1 Tax=Lophiostoma macrostomum CBS 122681 TaxID=1314788 RepID=A0A6A6T464_9PLEO|nr:hypothetical protein K491DRAFT_693739 [Lophiostoma macrostomum CBS 122681]
MSLSGFLFVYVLGGLTFIPLVLSVVLLHAYLTLPADDAASAKDGRPNEKSPAGGSLQGSLSDSAFESLPNELKTRTHVPDVAAGYFAVCREYVPGGINGKPPERTTPAGSVVAAESPSVYQSMYRSIFDRNKSMSPTLEGANGKSKKGRNVFYVVLRLGILMLYDDSEQLEVRHVISLAHYDVDIYAGGEAIPEGELWIKRNCIRLTQRQQAEGNASDSKPFYLFSENCSEKEDFYHAMLQSQDHRGHFSRSPPVPLKFDTPDMVKLVQQLHASEENLNTRWINALVGRLFLAFYKTDDVERFIWTKITKKIARVPKPALISRINLQKVEMGTLPPVITNPKLKELTVDGDLTVEADVSYKGNFRVVISAVARIELGSRFKAREVTLVLATTLKKLEGHVLLRIKPPPSNRLWFTFESAPKMELLVEPMMSSRQITYGVILRAIESRLREVVSETLVQPNWDDIPFKDTGTSQYRGGIWTEDANGKAAEQLPSEVVDQPIASADKSSESEDEDSVLSIEGTKSARTTTSSSMDSTDTQATAFSSAIDAKPASKPRAIRKASFASAASPVVNIDAANASATKNELRDRQDAASTMQSIHRSQPTSPAETPVGSPSKSSSMQIPERRRSTSPAGFQSNHSGDTDDERPLKGMQGSTTSPNLSSDTSAKSKHATSLSLPRNAVASNEKRQMFNQSLNSATAAAKKWFANRQNQNPDSPSSSTPAFAAASSREQTPTLPNRTHDDPSYDREKDIEAFLKPSSGTATPSEPLGSPANPIGRGQPIPEFPIPKSEKSKWNVVPTASTLANLARRKPLPTKRPEPQSESKDLSESPKEQPPPPLPARTPTISQHSYTNHERKTSVGTTAMGGSHERKTSVGTAAMGVKRKTSYGQPLPSSAASAMSGGSSSRWQRRATNESMGASSVASSDGGGGGTLDGLLVVEAPTEGSTPTTPVATIHDVGRDGQDGREDKKDGEDQGDRVAGDAKISTPEDREEGVFHVDVDVNVDGKEGVT